MKTATVRDLRNKFSKIEAWIAEGEEICVTKRGKPVAYISDRPLTATADRRLPNFQARLDEIWGDRVFTESEVVAMRESELETEEG